MDEFPPDPKENIKLEDVIQSVLSENQAEKVKEAAIKIRHVLVGLEQAKSRIKKAQEQIKKDEERIQKGLDKINRIKTGDWNILNSININEKEGE